MTRVASCVIFIITILHGPSLRAQVVWCDEFDGLSIDKSTWTYDIGGHGFGNGQFEFNTARQENSYLQGGCLVIEARRERYADNAFTSARMLTQGRFAYKYGTLEARIKLPDTANGIWPAFWLLGNNFPAITWPRSGEIDILEIGSKQGIEQGLQRRKINCAIHYSDDSGRKASKVAWTDANVDLNRDFHVYKVDWTPERLSFYLDDVQFGEWDITAEQFAEFHQPFFPILNVAVGGWDPSYTGVYRVNDVTASFPARMYVDWIRLTRNPHTQVLLGRDQEETGKFGVFTESPAVKSGLTFGDDSASGFEYGSRAALYIWNNMAECASPPPPAEGSQCWSFDIAAGNWFGMGVLVPNFRNMARYSDGLLHFHLRTKSDVALRVGIKSSRGGEFFLPVGDENAEFGFPRDGQWHQVTIPLNRFANIDFLTVHQLFMISGEAPLAAMNLSIDNVWWQPSAPRPTPQGGNFGVFTENEAHKSAGEFKPGENGGFFIWENTLREVNSQPAEGRESKHLVSAPGMNWFGAAFTPNVKYDLSEFGRPGCVLHFLVRTRSQAKFSIGIKSGNMEGIGQVWIAFEPGRDPFHFVRDGLWHAIDIPMSEIAEQVDLSQVSQLFQILGTDGPIGRIEFDDICFLRSEANSDR